eukprot:comp21008_c0_seq1/m.28197 comp21008_c0_seq1/g.28197  ORF comp21008_c0_seq1/g.28197 comp21008_c0_seq1/m.28197 type:complete len:270 (-) comp21008_c0_seq1:276-1085(-)
MSLSEYEEKALACLTDAHKENRDLGVKQALRLLQTTIPDIAVDTKRARELLNTAKVKLGPYEPAESIAASISELSVTPSPTTLVPSQGPPKNKTKARAQAAASTYDRPDNNVEHPKLFSKGLKFSLVETDNGLVVDIGGKAAPVKNRPAVLRHLVNARNNPTAVGLSRKLLVHLPKTQAEADYYGVWYYMQALVQGGLDTDENLVLLFGSKENVADMQADARAAMVFMHTTGVGQKFEDIDVEPNPRSFTKEELAPFKDLAPFKEGLFG